MYELARLPPSAYRPELDIKDDLKTLVDQIRSHVPTVVEQANGRGTLKLQAVPSHQFLVSILEPPSIPSFHSHSTKTLSLVQEYTLKHPKLGFILGLARGSDLVQFCRIPFADIPARFRQSKLRTTLPEQPFDARQPG